MVFRCIKDQLIVTVSNAELLNQLECEVEEVADWLSRKLREVRKSIAILLACEKLLNLVLCIQTDEHLLALTAGESSYCSFVLCKSSLKAVAPLKILSSFLRETIRSNQEWLSLIGIGV